MIAVDNLSLWPESEEILKKYFQFDKIFDLLPYSNDFESLKQDLINLKKDSYDINYRFIFLHYDTDYYVYPDAPGLVLFNLQKILVELGIPNFFCLIITNHNNLSFELEYLRKHFTTDQCAISFILHQLQKCHVTTDFKDVDINFELINKNYSCFNRSRRFHRRALVSLLQHNNLLDQGIVSYVK